MAWRSAIDVRRRRIAFLFGRVPRGTPKRLLTLQTISKRDSDLEGINMGSQGAIVLLGAITVIAVVAWGAVAARRSIAIAVCAVLVAMLAALGGWHAHAESQSLPWTVGYGGLALVSLAVAIRHMVGGRAKSET